MPDLQRAFGKLDEIPVPDLRHDIERREPREAPVQTPSARARITAGIVAFAVFAAVLVLGWRSFIPGVSPENAAAPRIYRDPAGWSLRVPGNWHVLAFDVSDGALRFEGVQVSNVALPRPRIVAGSPIQASSKVLPRDGVALIVARSFGPPGGNEVPLPLSLGEFAMGSAPAGAPTLDTAYFAAGGWTFVATVKTGASAHSDATRAVARTVASFRFPQPSTSACVSSQLSGRLAGSEGAAGTSLFTVALTNTSTSACHLQGSPAVDMLGSSGAPLPVERRPGLPEGPSLEPSTVVLSRGEEAELVVAFTDVAVGQLSCLRVSALRITPMGSGGALDVPVVEGTQVCSRTVWAAPFAAYTGAS
jgi:hypothetical protein